MVQDELWASLKRKLREVTTAAADFTEEQARIGKLKFEILTLKRRIDGELRSLGARVLELSRKSPPSANPLADPLVKRHIRETGGLEAQVAKKRDDIGRVADEVRLRRRPEETGSATPTKAKPKAGKKRPAKAKK